MSSALAVGMGSSAAIESTKNGNNPMSRPCHAVMRWARSLTNRSCLRSSRGEILQESRDLQVFMLLSSLWEVRDRHFCRKAQKIGTAVGCQPVSGRRPQSLAYDGSGCVADGKGLSSDSLGRLVGGSSTRNKKVGNISLPAFFTRITRGVVWPVFQTRRLNRRYFHGGI